MEQKPANHNLIYSALQTLIAEGRVTGVNGDFKLDGVAFVALGDNTYDPAPVSEWNEDGTSKSFSEFGGQQIKEVEELRAELLRSGDARKERIAHELPQYFVRLDNVEHFTDKQEYFARENHAVVFMVRAMAGMEQPVLSTMQEYSPRFLEKGTQNPSYAYNRPMSEVDYNLKNPSNPGEMIPNHRIAVIKGGTGWTPAQITDWARRWVSQYEQSGQAPVNGLGGGMDGSNQ